jgi:hypothetical protein
MEKLSGLVLDIYDDSSGEVLRSIFPQEAGVPDLIKEAHYITPEERDALPDHVFSLVLHNDGTCLRKYACTDPGNTALSVEYFLKTAHKLPTEAQKVAAENLATACGWYGIEPPEQLQKIALGLMTAASLALSGPQIAKETGSGIKRNLQMARASGGAINPNIPKTVKQ